MAAVPAKAGAGPGREDQHRRSCCSCCCRCCGRLGAVLAGLVAALALALELPGPEPETGFRPSSAAAALQEIPRIHASELTEEDFYRRFVLEGVPVLIQLPLEGGGDASLHTLVDDLLASPCAERRLELMSKQQADLVHDLEALEGWTRRAVEVGLQLFAGVDLAGWVRQRRISLQELHSGVAAAGSRRDPVAVRFVSLVSLLSGGLLSKGYVAVAKLVSQPVYLADQPVDEICEEVLGPFVNSAAFTGYELHALEELERFRERGGRRNLSEVQPLVGGLELSPEVRLFWGGSGSYSYPLHRDVSDADVVCVVYSGCKDLVILRPSARRHLDRLAVPGFEALRQFTWTHDAYVDPPVPDVEGWSGTVRAGELLFMPGEMFHHIKNRCPQSVSLCRRPWRSSEMRDIMAESLKSLNLMKESDLLEEGLRTLRERVRKRSSGAPRGPARVGRVRRR
uniref:JmjC domain-containing protein n=1 Tax=Alexandrium monilatum TaxID=311494 RepID=A0A7S4VI10_9DINO|mmetsp:Transcript_50320/g.150336  ORF Transcript_50320/g.150336 Transcript_50320/m.150336 type:complete len:454 (+) Transcript_50320:66-1427(+)